MDEYDRLKAQKDTVEKEKHDALIAPYLARAEKAETEISCLIKELDQYKLWHRIAEEREELRAEIKRQCGTLSRHELEDEIARLTAQLSLDCDRANALGVRAEKAEAEVARLREQLILNALTV